MTDKLYPSFFLSAFFHSLFILVLILGIKNSVHDFKNLTYVTLIEETGNQSAMGSAPEKTTSKEIPQTIPETKTAKETKQTSHKNEITEKPIKQTPRTTTEDEELLKERLAALKAKKRVMERAKVGSIESSQKNNKGEGIPQNYLSIISGLIRQNWVIPDTVSKSLEAVVSVKIFPNGQIVIEKFEKKSGNAIFDASVIRAIKNSSPLPPPKSEVVVGLRFKP